MKKIKNPKNKCSNNNKNTFNLVVININKSN